VTRLRGLERSAENAARLLRNTISADLHDGLGQELAGLNLSIAAMRQRVSQGAVVADTEFDRLSMIIGLAIESCRHIVRGLSPISEYDGGLLLALRHLFERAEIPGGPKISVSVTERAPVCLSAEVADHLYRICQEALGNALKHARASTIRLTIAVQRQAVSVDVADDGIGFDLATAKGSGFGLGVMRHRATAAHIRLTQTSAPGAGTTLRLVCLQPTEHT
jgi:signal transduction histidine kinase